MPEHKIDEVGYWTEIKLNILREYAAAYATIMDCCRLCHNHG